VPRRGEGAPKKKLKQPPRRPSEKSTAQVQRESDARAARQARIFGANQAAFVPAVLVKPPPRPKPGFRGTRPTAREAYKAEVDAERDRSNLAKIAAISPTARRRIRETETKVERQVRQGTLLPPPRSRNLGPIAGAIGGAGDLLGRAGIGLARRALDPVLQQPVLGGRPGLLPPPAAGALAGAKVAADATLAPLKYGVVGPDLFDAAMGQEYDPTGLKIDVALAPLAAVAAPVRGARAAVMAAKALPQGRAAAKAAYIATKEGPMLATSLVTAARRSAALRGSPERKEVHAAIDALYSGDKQLANTIKGQLDAEVHRMVKAAPKEERQATVSGMYREQLDALAKDAPADVKVNVLRNARIEAELNPRNDPLPRGGVLPIDEEATASHIARSIEQASRMKSLSKDPAHLLGVFREAHRLAGAGVRFRRWYRTSAMGILNHVHGDKEEADKLAQLFGIYSANRDVPANSVLALRAYDEARAGRAITQGSGPQTEAAEKVMSGTPWDGRKTNSFYSNMLKHIDNKKYRKEFGNREVTVDIWMMRMFGFTGKSPTEAQYNYIENQIRELARQLGWEPEEVQAAAWVALKAESENTSLEKAAFDFAHGIDTHRGQINVLPAGLPEEHARTLLRLIEPVRDIVGIPGAGGHAGAGGAAHYIPLVRTKGDKGDYVISEAERQMADEASAAYGMVLDMPEVAYGRVFQAKSIGHANAVQLSAPGGLSAEQERAIARAVGEGTDIVHTANGAWLINNTGGTMTPGTGRSTPTHAGTYVDNKAWIKSVEKALREADPTLGRNAVAVAFDGNVIPKEGYEDALRQLEARRPGAREALDRIASDARRAGGLGGARTAEHSGPGSADRFSGAVARSRTGEHGRFISELSDADAAELEARGYRFFLSDDDAVHYAISPEGDFGYFGSSIRGAGRASVEQAIAQGARTLDAFDGFLPDYYAESGFREVARNPWNDEYAPANWNYERDGRPDVVHMAYRPDQPYEKTAVYTDDWDEAKALSQRPLGNVPPVSSGIRLRPEGAGDSLAMERAALQARYRDLSNVPDKTMEQWDELARVEAQLTGREAPPPARPPDEPPAPAGAAGEPEPVDLVKEVRSRVRGGAGARREQRRSNLEEAGRRAKAGEEAMLGLEGSKAMAAAREVLLGKYPQVVLGGVKRDLDPETFELMVNHVAGHPELLFYEKIRGHTALMKMVNGQELQPNEAKLLYKAFPRETIDSIKSERSNLAKVGRAGIQLYHVPRTLMSTLDMSFGGRQALVYMTRHPVMWSKAWREMHKVFGSEKMYEASSRQIMEHPLYPLMLRARIAFTDLGDDLYEREEMFMSPFIERGKRVNPIRMSSRAYSGMGNKVRADHFTMMMDRLVRYAHKQGYDTLDEMPDFDKALRDIGRLINSASGRGTGKDPHGKVEMALKSLQPILFSPRLLKSRLDFLNPVFYAQLHPVARQEALQSLASLTAVVGGVLSLAALAGAQVQADPRDSDFGKIKIGDTRIDMLGGHAQVIRLYSNILWTSKVAIEQLRGNNWVIEQDKYSNPKEYLERFLRSKLAPVPSFLWDLGSGTDYKGDPIDVRKAAYERMMPILVSDLIELHQNNYPKEALLPYPLAFYGIGVSTYDREESVREREENKNWDDPGGGGGDWWEEDGGEGDWWK
jgi:hypothetical protein